VNGFIVVARLGDGLYRVTTDGWPALWVRRTLRRDAECAATGAELHKGERHYGPVGNMMYRFRRLSTDFVEGRRE
jgi:hypothetical protein